MAKLIRLRPLDAKKGHVIRRYTAFSNTFEEAKGWYRVSDAVAGYLATVHQVPTTRTPRWHSTSAARRKRSASSSRRRSAPRSVLARPTPT